ncbi:DUF2520 domain-containing protein [Marinicella sediminis]|uniref:DUF2520 domain-containing protein n=1 Tax=Marinicella sediminis TaxID=1792834 RepID=A0ABV7J5G8_9GAMM|nr:Rossmann-like and DUF2520 domain-containing protein [Marinicella sediminis]
MNRQVPETIAIIGNGKVARHLVRYCDLVGQPHVQWFRHAHPEARAFGQKPASRLARFRNSLRKLFSTTAVKDLATTVAAVKTVLILLPDDQIESFITRNPVLQHKNCIHFSGSLQTSLASGCHPLMTFGGQPYDLDQYQKIPFVIDLDVDFQQLFPLFNNPTHVIDAEHKVLYHALCVMAGNFSQTLWRLVGQELAGMNLPADLMSSYLKQNTQNFINHPETAATGPFVRGDLQTIDKHIQALTGHPLGEVYQAFYKLHQQHNPTQLRSQSS